MQHAILRGIEAVFQLEEGEMLAEPMPTRDVRNGFLLYEATEGGAGRSHAAREPGEGSRRPSHERRLHIMHFDGRRRFSARFPVGPRGSAGRRLRRGLLSLASCRTTTSPTTRASIRRDEDARAMLLRLARARTARTQPIAATFLGVGGELRVAVTVSRVDRWLAEATRRGFPAPDPKPLETGERSVRCIWRRHYVAALIDEADLAALQPLEDLGFEVIQFEDPEDWRAPFAQLASALGLAS